MEQFRQHKNHMVMGFRNKYKKYIDDPVAMFFSNLAQLEQFIAQHHCLPEQSANDRIQNGLHNFMNQQDRNYATNEMLTQEAHAAWASFASTYQELRLVRAEKIKWNMWINELETFLINHGHMPRQGSESVTEAEAKLAQWWADNDIVELAAPMSESPPPCAAVLAAQTSPRQKRRSAFNLFVSRIMPQESRP